MSERKLGLILGTEPRPRASSPSRWHDLCGRVGCYSRTLPRPDHGGRLRLRDAGQRSVRGLCVGRSVSHTGNVPAKRGHPAAPVDSGNCACVVFRYQRWAAGPPSSSSDQGSNPQTAMQYWRTNGLPAHQIAGDASEWCLTDICRAIYDSALRCSLWLCRLRRSRTACIGGGLAGHRVVGVAMLDRGRSYTPDC